MALVKLIEYAEAASDCTCSHTAAARKKGMTESMFLELMAVTGLANKTNRLANGLRVPVDPQFLPKG